MKRFNSKYLQVRVYEDEVDIATTIEGGKLLSSSLVSATSDDMIRQTKWKFSHEFILGALCEEMAQAGISELENFMDLRDKQKVHEIVDSLYWDGEVSLLLIDKGKE